MNHYIKINTETLRNDSGTIEELVISAEKQLQEVYLETESLEGMWEGSAKEAFVTQFALDYAALKNVCSYVKSFAENLGKAAAEYERCESGVKEAIDAIKV